LYPKRESLVNLPLQLLELRKRAKHPGCWRLRSRNICFGHVPVAVRQGQRGDAVATGEERHSRFSAGKSIYPASSVQWQVSPRADVPSTSSSRWPLLFGGRSTTDTSLYRWRLRQKKTFGVGLRCSCRGQTFGGMLGAMARIAPAGGTTRSTEAQTTIWASNR
jgi:hypothetical protein